MASSLWNVTHLIYLKRTEGGIHFNIGRIPHGPKLIFQLNKYTLSSEIRNLRRGIIPKNIHLSPPLVILHGFSGEEPHVKLMLTTFQQLFPSIRPSSARIGDIRRVVLFSYNKNTKEICLRHYCVRVDSPSDRNFIYGILENGNLPDLSKCNDISDYILR